MSNLLISSASDIIIRARVLETEGKLTQSLVCYEEGIGLLLKCMKCATGKLVRIFIPSDTKLKLNLKERIESYISRAEEIKQTIKQKQKGIVKSANCVSRSKVS